MSMERWIPIGLRSQMRPFHHRGMERRPMERPSSLLQHQGPSWDMAPADQRLDNFGMTLQQMDQQMKHMIQDMDRMFEDFMRVQPAASFGQWREDQALQQPIITDPDGSRNFRLNIDLSHFKPEEIQVRTKENMLEVHAKHEQDGEGGRVFREYRRMFTLPKEVKPEALKSTLTAAGVLALEATIALPAIEQPKDHVIPIKHE